MSEKKLLEVTPGEYMHTANDEPKTVSFFMHENAMMHKDADNQRANRTTLFVCLFALLFALIFVVAYTIRMNTFVDLIKEMNAAVVELARAKGIAP